MDGSTLQQIRDNLLSRKLRLGGEISRERALLAHTDDMISPQAEIIDIAQALEQIDRDQSLAEQERRELVMVEHALAKISTGAFGVCEDCEEEIPPKRLAIVPEARLCARCQAFEEKQQSRTMRVAGMSVR